MQSHKSHTKCLPKFGQIVRLLSQIKPNIRPNSLAKLWHSLNFGPSLVDKFQVRLEGVQPSSWAFPVIQQTMCNSLCSMGNGMVTRAGCSRQMTQKMQISGTDVFEG